MANLIDMEKKRRGIKSKASENLKKIGKGFAGFASGAAKGFFGLAKEGAKSIAREIKAEVDTEIKVRRAYIDARRKGRLIAAERAASKKYGLPYGKKKKGKKNKKNKSKGFRIVFD